MLVVGYVFAIRSEQLISSPHLVWIFQASRNIVTIYVGNCLLEDPYFNPENIDALFFSCFDRRNCCITDLSTEAIAGGIAKPGQSSWNQFKLQDVNVGDDTDEEGTSKKKDIKSGTASNSKPSEEAARRSSRQSAAGPDRGSNPLGSTFSTGPRSVGGWWADEIGNSLDTRRIGEAVCTRSEHARSIALWRSDWLRAIK